MKRLTNIMLYVLIVGLVLHAPFITFWENYVGYAELIFRAWKEILVTVLLIVRLPAIYSNKLWRNQIVRLVITYVVLHLIYFLVFYSEAPSFFGLRTNLVMFALLIIGLSFDEQSPLVEKAKQIIIILGGLVSISVLAQAALPESWFIFSATSDILGSTQTIQDSSVLRFHGLLSGPLQLGSYLILPIALVFDRFIKTRYKNLWHVAYILLGFAGILMSYSRAALGGLLVALIVIFLLNAGHKINRQTIIWAAACGVFACVSLVLIALTWEPLSLIVFHAEPEKALKQSSTSDHFIYPYEATLDLIEQPLGYGLGEAGPASFYGNDPRVVENNYLQIGLEVGIAGVVIFGSIILLTYKALKGQNNIVLVATLIALSVMAIVLHTWTDTATAWTWWLLAGLSLANPRRADKHSK